MAVAKPEYCQRKCPLGLKGRWICRDLVLSPGRPQRAPGVILIAERPTTSDILAGRAMTGPSARYWRAAVGEDYWKVHVLGARYLIRCTSTVHGKMPRSTREVAHEVCDAGLLESPDVHGYYLTFDLATAAREYAFQALWAHDVRRACEIAVRHGIRLGVLMGDRCLQYVAPWIAEGSARDLRGHWWVAPERDRRERSDGAA
jgi:hypothetical protein